MVLLDKLYGLQYPLNILPTYALVYSQVYSNCFADNFGRPCLLVVLIVSNPSLCIYTFQRSPALPCNLTSSKATHYTGIRASAPTSSLAHYFIRHGLHQSRIPIPGNYRVVSPTLRQPWISAVDHPKWKPQHVVALVISISDRSWTTADATEQAQSFPALGPPTQRSRCRKDDNGNGRITLIRSLVFSVPTRAPRRS